LQRLRPICEEKKSERFSGVGKGGFLPSPIGKSAKKNVSGFSVIPENPDIILLRIDKNWVMKSVQNEKN